jgi:hypothetical protein
MTVNSLSGGQYILIRLVDCDATLDLVSKDFAQRFWLPTPKSKVKTPFRFAYEQRVTSSTSPIFPSNWLDTGFNGDFMSFVVPADSAMAAAPEGVRSQAQRHPLTSPLWALETL